MANKRLLKKLGIIMFSAVLIVSPAASVQLYAAETGSTAEAPAPVEEPPAPVEEPPAPAEEGLPEEPTKQEPPAPAEEPEQEPTETENPSEEIHHEPVSEPEEQEEGEDTNSSTAEEAKEKEMSKQTGTDIEKDDEKQAEDKKQDENKKQPEDKGKNNNKKPDEKNGDKPEGEEEAEKHTGSNEDLMRGQKIISIPKAQYDFRFFTCEYQQKYAKDAVYVYEETDISSEKVGAAGRNAEIRVLLDKDDWCYVEAGQVRGFVKTEELSNEKTEIKESDKKEHTVRQAEKHKKSIYKTADKNRADIIRKMTQEDDNVRDNKKNLLLFNKELIIVDREYELHKVSETDDTERPRKEDIADGEVKQLVSNNENDAFAYYRGTSYDHVVEKEYALSAGDASICESPGGESRVVGKIYKNSIMYIIDDVDDWYFVESGNTRGFVEKTQVVTGNNLEEDVKNNEGAYSIAEQLVSPSDNRATYYTIMSVKEGNEENPVRKEIVELALSCVGNPYVWGGTSLTNGADCSGFVQTLYKQYGYSLPRVAESQAYYGTKIPVEDAEPGDLIFFAKNGYIYHVAMSLGDGKTVEAYSSGYGIITHSVEGRSTIWATRILND